MHSHKGPKNDKADRVENQHREHNQPQYTQQFPLSLKEGLYVHKLSVLDI
jgi:hypothetical protein